MKKTLFILALLAIACTKVVEIESEPVAKDEVKTIPYSVTVSTEQTRATVDDDMMTLRFATGDRLYISCDTRADVYGVLELETGAGETGENGEVVFTGDLNYTGDVPSDDLLLNATLVGINNVGVQIGEDGKVKRTSDGNVDIKYPEYNVYCTNVNDAVHKYSLLTGVGTFGRKRFPLSQHTAFLNFAVNADGVNNANVNFSVYFNNGGQSYLLGKMNTGTAQQSYQIRFALPVAEGTVLENASLNLVRGNDFSGTPASIYTAAFGGTEAKTLSPKVYIVTKTAVAHTGFVDTGLPVIEINTLNGVGVGYIDSHKDEEQSSQVIIHVNGKNDIVPKADKDEGNPNTNCTIKGRGNTTWGWDKKPYKLKLEKKTALLQEIGLSDVTAASKHWVLLANYMDRTMMRNMVAMEVSKITNLPWTPHCTPVELYIDGEHRGNYLLIEQVRVEDGRVDVNTTETPSNPNDVGFMMELDFHFDNWYGDVKYDNTIQWRELHGTSKYGSIEFRDGNGTNNKGIPFSIKEPDWSPKEGETPVNDAQLNYIKGYVAAAGATLFKKTKNSDFYYGTPNPDPNVSTGYPNYLDVPSFIDYWIVFETMINHEIGNPGSVYMTKPRNGKLTAGPCWDFDWGTLSYHYSSRTPNPQNNLMNADAIWYRSLMTDKSFVQQLYNRFVELESTLETVIPARIDEWEREMAASAEVNFKMWNPAGAGGVNGDESLSYHEAVDRIKTIFVNRLSFIETELSNRLKAFPSN